MKGNREDNTWSHGFKRKQCGGRQTQTKKNREDTAWTEKTVGESDRDLTQDTDSARRQQLKRKGQEEDLHYHVVLEWNCTFIRGLLCGVEFLLPLLWELPFCGLLIFLQRTQGHLLKQ